MRISNFDFGCKGLGRGNPAPTTPLHPLRIWALLVIRKLAVFWTDSCFISIRENACFCPGMRNHILGRISDYDIVNASLREKIIASALPPHPNPLPSEGERRMRERKSQVERV